MVSKVVTKEVPGLTMDEIKTKLVETFETAFNESVDDGNIDLSDFSDDDDIVEDVTGNWHEHAELEGIVKVIEAFGFKISGSVARTVTFEIK